jgi:Restriction endonuclease
MRRKLRRASWDRLHRIGCGATCKGQSPIPPKQSGSSRFPKAQGGPTRKLGGGRFTWGRRHQRGTSFSVGTSGYCIWREDTLLVKPWEQYQHRTAGLLRELGFTAEVNDPLRALNGVVHAVDVSARIMLAGVSVLWIVECKLWNKAPVPKEKVSALKDIVNDLAADRGLLMSENRIPVRGHPSGRSEEPHPEQPRRTTNQRSRAADISPSNGGRTAPTAPDKPDHQGSPGFRANSSPSAACSRREAYRTGPG